MAKKTTKPDHAPNDADAKAQAALDAVRTTYAGTVPTVARVRAAVVVAARAFVGVREIGSSNSGYWIDQFLGQLGLNPGYAWCMAVVQWVLRFVASIFGLPDLLPNNQAGTRNVFLWAKGKGYTTVDIALVQPGDVIVWADGATANGHTGIVVDVTRNGSEYILTVAEGNTSDKSWRDGGGMMVKTHTIADVATVGRPVTSGRWVRGFIQLDPLFNASVAALAAAPAIATKAAAAPQPAA
jgi:hypothetical protein